MKNQRGVTLIALVVTIIVLIILAGIAIAALMGDNGVITRSKLAKRNQIEGEVRDSINLAIQAAKMEAEQKAVSSPSFSAATELGTGTIIKNAIVNELKPTASSAGDNGYHVATANGSVTITYTSADYKNATNDSNASIICYITVTGNSFAFNTNQGDNSTGWDYTPNL